MTADNVTAAEAIRAELRELAQEDPRLAAAKISVRATRASMMSAVTVRITGYGDGRTPISTDRTTARLRAAVWVIVNRHWDYNGKTRFADVYVNGTSL